MIEDSKQELNNQQHFLVTGVAGFIGSRTAEILLKRGEYVVGIDNLNDYYSTELKKYRLKELEKYPNFYFQYGDLESNEFVYSIVRSSTKAIFNLAARAGPRTSVKEPYIYFSTNVVGTLNILEAMKKYEVKKLVLASTSSLYAGHPLPWKETEPVNYPISPYAASKKSAEVLSYTYHSLYNMDVTVLRYFTVYGPCGRPDMMPYRFIQWVLEGRPIQVYGDGLQSRDFTYVDDVALATVCASELKGYQVLNIGAGKKPTKILDAIAKIEEFTGKKAKLDFKPSAEADFRESYADITEAQRVIHWQPTKDFYAGLQHTIEWHIYNQQWLKQISAC